MLSLVRGFFILNTFLEKNLKTEFLVSRAVLHRSFLSLRRHFLQYE